MCKAHVRGVSWLCVATFWGRLASGRRLAQGSLWSGFRCKFGLRFLRIDFWHRSFETKFKHLFRELMAQDSLRHLCWGLLPCVARARLLLALSWTIRLYGRPGSGSRGCSRYRLVLTEGLGVAGASAQIPMYFVYCQSIFNLFSIYFQSIVNPIVNPIVNLHLLYVLRISRLLSLQRKELSLL